KLRTSPFVAYAETDAVGQLTSIIPNDPQFSTEWGLNFTDDTVDINAPEAWEVTKGTPSTIVAVADTGIDYTHPDLYLNISVDQGEIPAAIKLGLVDTNSDGRLDFYDFNSLDVGGTVVLNGSNGPINAWATHDSNGNGYIDGGDLLADPTW